MIDPRWSATDVYLEQHLTVGDLVASATAAAQREGSLPDAAVSPTQGRMLAILARAVGARRVLEFGTLGGYSTLWLARAVPEDGAIVTFELVPEYAAVARASLDSAGVGGRVDIRVGAALDLLPSLEAEEPFDLVFIDADKQNGWTYFEASLAHTRKGSLIIVDNVVRAGQLAEEGSTDARVIGSRTLVERVAQDDRVDATVIQTVGRKGYDGFLLAVVL